MSSGPKLSQILVLNGGSERKLDHKGEVCVSICQKQQGTRSALRLYQLSDPCSNYSFSIKSIYVLLHVTEFFARCIERGVRSGHTTPCGQAAQQRPDVMKWGPFNYNSYPYLFSRGRLYHGFWGIS